MSTKKTLSVVMPNYNDASHIAISLKAICEQSYLPLEVIVVDDGSLDNSIAVIEEVIKQYPIVRLLRNETNQGVNYTVNRGAREARGDYIFFPAANDIVYPGFFEKSMELLNKYPEAGLCFCDLRTIMLRDGSSQHDCWMNAYGYFSPQQMAKMTAKNHYVFSACGANSIIRRDLLPKTEVYISELHTWGDWLLCKMIAFRHGSCYIPEPLVGVRCTEQDNLSLRVSQDQSYFQELCIKVIQLFSSPGNEDLAELIIASRALRSMRVDMRKPLTVLKAVSSLEKRNRYANALVNHLMIEYFRTYVDEWMHQNKTRGEQKYRLYRQHSQDVLVSAYHFMKNVLDRSYAHAYDKYRRARSLLNK